MQQSTPNKEHPTLVEWIIVIVVLCLLAAVAVPQLSSNSGVKTIKEEGNYIVYAEQGGVQNEIGTINLGEVIIQYPSKMTLNQSGVITVSLTSMNNEPTITSVSGDSTQQSNSYNMLSAPISLYPVMDVELLAANFDIGNQGNGTRAVSNDGAVWKWDVSPKTTGNQLLIAELDVPIQVQGFETQVIKAVYYKQFTINVRAPFGWGTFIIQMSAIIGIIGVLFGIWAYFNKHRKKKLSQ